MKNRSKLNKRLILPALIIGLAAAAAFDAFALSCDLSSVADTVLRLHVVAESDREDDQFVKLKVRDTILTETQRIAGSAKNKGEFVALVKEHLSDIERLANDTISALGYDYTAHACFERADFPTREYNGVTLPAGRYDALKVVIGRGEGQNFWCVMFPPLCGGAVEAKESKEYLKDNLSEGAFMMITDPQSSVRYELRLKVVDIINEIGSE
ncbi:MAG: stage II sporulation protein R [Clostridia bacterium]|nr:stage II sporulation protein R [Clostridia bacterium]